MADEFDLATKCRAASSEAVELWISLVKKGQESLNKAGADLALVNLAFKASQQIVAYAHGQPRQSFDHRLPDGATVNVGYDVSKLSTETLKELLLSRVKS